MRIAAAALLWGMVATSTTRVAFAQDDADRARAERAFKQALADEQAGRYDQAVAELLEAREAAHKETPQILFHLGVCHAHAGKVLAARDELRAAIDRAAHQGLENVAATARSQLEPVEARVATLTVPRPAHRTVTAVTVDGADVTARLGSALELDPGPHDVVASFSDGAPEQLRVTLGDGEHREVRLSEAVAPAPQRSVALPPPKPTGSAANPAPSAPDVPPPNPTPSAGTRTVGWFVLGGGAALVAGGAVLWALRQQEIDTLGPECGATRRDCPSSAQTAIDHGKFYDALGVTAFLAGGAAVLAGGGLLLFGPGPATTGARITPVLTAHGGGLTLGGALW